MALMRRVSIAASEYPSINPPWRQAEIADGDNGFGLVVHLHEDRNSQNANNPPSAMHSDSIDRVIDPESKGHTKTTTSITISANTIPPRSSQRATWERPSAQKREDRQQHQWQPQHRRPKVQRGCNRRRGRPCPRSSSWPSGSTSTSRRTPCRWTDRRFLQCHTPSGKGQEILNLTYPINALPTHICIFPCKYAYNALKKLDFVQLWVWKRTVHFLLRKVSPFGQKYSLSEI